VRSWSSENQTTRASLSLLREPEPQAQRVAMAWHERVRGRGNLQRLMADEDKPLDTGDISAVPAVSVELGDSEGDTEATDPTETIIAPEPISTASMLAKLQDATGADFAAFETSYESFMTGALSELQDSDIYGSLVDIHEALSDQRVLGTVRAIENWSNGEAEFRVVRKSWESLVDKLYRINFEENRLYSNPPLVRTIEEQAANSQQPQLQRWITPHIAHDVADDLLRTKFVVPFVDGVVEVSDLVTKAIDACGLRRFRRFHAKDSGYHARHFYILIRVPGYGTDDTTVALEVKVLTKLQDTLGELTHLLYEKHRTGEIPLQKKRKVAWQLRTADFRATYLGHSGHFLEAAICELKDQILQMEAQG
jgi:ppGpp synthetase/RelA/SpoT-type nucleotidyltranferase